MAAAATPSTVTHPRQLPWPLMTTYTLFHVAAVAGAVLLPFDTTAAVLVFFSYAVRMVAVTAGFHRYFSHRAYRLSRSAQFLIAVVGTSAWQRGPLWWASHHRVHHRTADTPDDPHRPKDGAWHAAVFWVFSHRAPRWKSVPDLAAVPELVALDKHHHLPPVALALIMTACLGASGLVHGFLIPTLLCWHVIGAVNTVGHRYGRRDFETGDESTNHALLALVTFGDGWHNGHHAFPRSARHGLNAGQLDLNFLLLKALASAGLVSGLRVPTAAQLARKRLPLQPIEGPPLEPDARPDSAASGRSRSRAP